jgi:hypothetical protein
MKDENFIFSSRNMKIRWVSFLWTTEETLIHEKKTALPQQIHASYAIQAASIITLSYLI